MSTESIPEHLGKFLYKGKLCSRLLRMPRIRISANKYQSTQQKISPPKLKRGSSSAFTLSVSNLFVFFDMQFAGKFQNFLILYPSSSEHFLASPTQKGRGAPRIPVLCSGLQSRSAKHSQEPPHQHSAIRALLLTGAQHLLSTLNSQNPGAADNR